MDVSLHLSRELAPAPESITDSLSYFNDAFTILELCSHMEGLHQKRKKRKR